MSQRLTLRNNIVYTRADKKSVIAPPKFDYINQTMNFYEFTIIKKEPTEKFQKRPEWVKNKSDGLFNTYTKIFNFFNESTHTISQK